jgi:hypothetical protein
VPWEDKTRYNLDKTSANADHSKQTAWQDQTARFVNDTLLKRLSTGTENPLGKRRQLIVLQIGGENGIVDNDRRVSEFHSTRKNQEEMKKEAFHKLY